MKYSLLSPSFLPIICSALWLSCQGPTAPFNEKTSELIELKVTEGTNMAVALSPDGNTLAFDLLGRIWLMPVSGGAGQPITDSLGNARQPSWSPDGKKLTFQGYWQGNWHIYIVNADGSNLKQMTSGDYDYREPHWSPDGTTLAFSSDRSGNYDIWTLDVVGEQLIPFTSSPTNEYGPTWSPDGQNLAFVSSDKASGKILIRSTINDSEQTIYNGHGKLTGISWSPTGKQLLFNEHAGIEAALKQIILKRVICRPYLGP
jgi:Tol biopolymer transport system component